MEINVAQFLKEPVGSIRTYEVTDVNEEGLPVTGEVQLVRTDRSILVKGRIETTVKSTCSRCLEQFDQKVAIEVEEEFFPTVDVWTGRPLPKPPEVDAFTIKENHVLDLSEAIRQYTVLAMPMKPVCKESCAGLCSTCGRNLNYGVCGCTSTHTDPRWARLQELLVGEKKAKRTKKRG